MELENITQITELTTKIDKYVVNKLKMERHKYDIPGEFFKTFVNKTDGRSISIKIISSTLSISSLLGYSPFNSEINNVKERIESLQSKIVTDETLQKMKRKKRRKITLKNKRRNEQLQVLSLVNKFYDKIHRKLSKKLKKLDFTIYEKGYGKSPIWFAAVNKKTVIVVQLQTTYFREK